MVVKPLHSLLTNYCKTKKITWTSEALNAFQQIKKEILKRTTMHFMNDTDPIYLHTDASDIGIASLTAKYEKRENHFLETVRSS
jgi:cytochrome c2